MGKLVENFSRSFLGGYVGKILISVLLVLGIFVGCDLTNEITTENTEKKWYKGHLHTHSYWSNGNDYPEMVTDWYKKRGYDFLAFSEHNLIAKWERWMDVPKGSEKEAIFKDYLKKFGEEWVEYTENGSFFKVKLKTLEEYRSRFEEDKQFLLFQSEEIHDNYQGHPVHVNATNIQEAIQPQGGNSVSAMLQNNIDAVLSQSEETGTTIIPHINHPNISWAITADDIKQLNGVRFFEVYSGHPNANNSGDSTHAGTEQMWDEVNTFNAQINRPLLYGLAVDDAQDYHSFATYLSNPGRGWIQVRSSGFSRDSIMAAMQRGDFYSSTGVRLLDIQFEGSSLTVTIDMEAGVNYTTQFIGTLQEQPDKPGVVLAEESGTEVSYTLKGNELFVRAKVISDKVQGNPALNEEGATEVAWTQPVSLYN